MNCGAQARKSNSESKSVYTTIDTFKTTVYTLTHMYMQTHQVGNGWTLSLSRAVCVCVIKK
jgi:hypothetical protein